MVKRAIVSPEEASIVSFALGGPGTGKTTVLNTLPPQFVAFVAHCGCAAARMRGGRTICSYFGITPYERSGANKKKRIDAPADLCDEDDAAAAELLAGGGARRVRGDLVVADIPIIQHTTYNGCMLYKYNTYIHTYNASPVLPPPLRQHILEVLLTRRVRR